MAIDFLHYIEVQSRLDYVMKFGNKCTSKFIYCLYTIINWKYVKWHYEVNIILQDAKNVGDTLLGNNDAVLGMIRLQSGMLYQWK